MQTLTFYSYKGGLGRTLMVANMARYLASFGKKVLAVDFDLEAPGLHYKLGVEKPERGLVDYLHQLFLAGEVPESLEPYVVSIEPESSTGGSLHLLPAGAAPSPAYWRQLARLDWHALFYSKEAPGVLLFLELQERISRELAPDFLLIDSRTGITEVGGATTSLLADRVICLLANNPENLEGAREVLRSLRRAPRLPGRAPLELWPVLSRIPEVGGEIEAGLVQRVLEFLCAEAEDLASTLTFPELFLLHIDPDLHLSEALTIGGGRRSEESPLLRDYLALFGKLIPAKDLLGPTLRDIAERWETDRASAEKDFTKLAELADRSVLESLLAAEIASVGAERAREVAQWFQEKASATAEESRSLLRAIGFPNPSEDLIRTATGYLQYLIDRYRLLDFRGMGVSDRVPLRLPLLDIYVPSKALRELPEGMREGAEMSKSSRVLDLLRVHDGLILLGNPGAGKTTFLKYLAVALASGQGEALGLGARLPVLLPLVAYADALVESETSLEDFLAKYFVDPGLGASLRDILTQAFTHGRVLLLLDGLDEVWDKERRKIVEERVLEVYLRHRPAGNKLVLTSRTVGYWTVGLKAEGLVEATVAGFTAEDIKSFVEKWTVALEQGASRESAPVLFATARERDELLAAIHSNPGVRGLAANPLLLTVLALMKLLGMELSVRRVEVYEICFDTLLRHGNLARSLAGHSGLDLDLVETLKILAPLALWIHRVSSGKGAVNEEELLQWVIAHIHQERRDEAPSEVLRWFLQDVREHSGLLHRSRGHWGFIHLSFQEYLAAVALAQRARTGVGELTRFVTEHVGDPAWREVILLAVAYLGVVQKRDAEASEAVEDLLQVKEPPGAGVVLAGEAVADIGVDGVTLSCRMHTIEALISTMLDEKVPAPVRAEAGRTLVRLGVKFAGDVWL